jgi:dTDP-4-amino-4,6-dideoxygalactose transaminase
VLWRFARQLLRLEVQAGLLQSLHVAKFAIPAFPSWENRMLREQLHRMLDVVIDSGQWVLGPQVEALELEIAALLEVPHAVATASGTDALELALRLSGVGVGDRVALPSLCPSAVPCAIARCGARCVVIDVEADSWNLCPKRLAAVLLDSHLGPIKAVVAVHLFGQAVDWVGLDLQCRQAGVTLIEDASQAFGGELSGRALGSLGKLGVMSCYPTKNLGALGDAGFVFCSEAAQREQLRCLRQYGWRQRHISEVPGINSRMDELQAAFLRLKLTGSRTALQQRADLAELYTRHLRDCPDLSLQVSRLQARHAWHQFVIRSPRAASLAGELIKHGVDPGVSCRVPVCNQPAWDGVRHDCGTASAVGSQLIALPMHPGISAGEVIHLCGVIQQVLA